MASPRQHEELSPRDREILKDVIYSYILHGEPVSSRAVAKHERHGLSSASVRNIMADLEELGYLRQPHTSAGRVPTVDGYHFYIEALMRQRSVSARDRRYVRRYLEEVGGDADGRINAASHLLSELSNQAGVVLVPALGDTVLKAVDFVPLSGRKVLCVIVSMSGFVDSKIVELDNEVTRRDLVQAGNYLTDNFAGLTMREIRDRLVSMMEDERAAVDQVLGLVVQLARHSLVDDDDPAVVVDGTEGLLRQPELSDLTRAQRLFETFKDKARLVSLLNQCVEGAGVRIWIGEDSELTSELDLSLVATTYSMGESVQGSLGIVGPSRMEYERVIPLVEFLAATLSDALTTTFDG